MSDASKYGQEKTAHQYAIAMCRSRDMRIAELEALLKEILPQVVNSNVSFRYVRKIEKTLGYKSDG